MSLSGKECKAGPKRRYFLEVVWKCSRSTSLALKVKLTSARARWHEHGEKSTKYFLNLEKRNHIKKHVRKLHISGVMKTDPFRILTVLQKPVQKQQY